MRQRNEYAEPYKIKSVEHIKLTERTERLTKIEDAFYNLFNIKAEDVNIDLLTDSGTSAMSSNQWSAIMMGDESYAGARSFFKIKEAVEDIFGYKYLVLAHQGRAAENILMKMLISPGQKILGNMHFDTTLGHIRINEAIPENLICKTGLETSSIHPFKGNIDLNLLEKKIKIYGKDQIPFIIITITCNNNGGQPVSMENIKSVSAIAKKNNIPLFFDAARFAENCYFIKIRESGYKNKKIIDIARELFSYGDGALMSSKKDALVNMGGFIAFKNNEDLYNSASQLQICYEGYKTYGGLSGRDMEALAVGLYEGIQLNYLEDRIGQVHYLGEGLLAEGIPIQQPTGGHGVYLDAGQMFPSIPKERFPAQALAIALYEEGGIRGVEIGSSALGYRDKTTGRYVWPEMEMVRLAIPRRVYTDRHMDMVIQTARRVEKNKHKIKGMIRTYETDIMSHFTAKFKKYT